MAVIKGTAGACYYPVPEFRNMGDVDLLVRPKDYRRAIDILKENGFAVVGEDGARKSYQIYKGNTEWKETGADAERIVWIRMMLQGQHENMMPLCMCPGSTGVSL